MIALLTGGAGVVGKALCRELIARGVCVRVLTLPGDSLAKSLPAEVDIRYGDVTDFDSIRDAFENVDVVYHLAAILLSTKPGAFEFVNTEGTRNVITASQKAHVRRFLYVSSISVTYPVLTPYGKSKKKGEELVHASGLDWTIVRPTLVIGDGGGVEFNTKKVGDVRPYGGGNATGVKVDPIGFLVIKDGTVRMVNVTPPASNTVDRIIDLVPQVMDRVDAFIEKQKSDK
jgi:nucleoside-diphosphate-sugar epimerase